MASIKHLHENRVAVERKSDHIWFQFMTYRYGPTEWGYELVRANCQPTSMVSDPDYYSEAEVVAAIHDHVEHLQVVPGYGWCVVQPDMSAPSPGM